ncbi:sorting nexin-29 isoform X3 [Petromyzon marinus]|uniref:Sorting nexin-29 n=1 Tax=Petromyzon marinus TaxID=7757 RepID=A0AAJ7TY98_PETMA|nr:sorting nexin-29 [Petromyzon marinus]
MSGVHNENERQALLDRLLDAVKQCQIRFGGKKEIAFDSDSRVTCLCAQFEAVLQHGLRRGSRGLALTAAALKQVTGMGGKIEPEPVFWHFVREQLGRHELQRYLTLRAIGTDAGRGRAWLRSALNEHSLERHLHTLLAERQRISQFYEDWAFLLDDERSSMLPVMSAGLNSIVFAINIDNEDLNGGLGVSRGAPTMSGLLRESTQSVTSLLRDSSLTHGVSSLLREISGPGGPRTSGGAAVVPVASARDTALSVHDPAPVMSARVADVKNRKERKKRSKKPVTSIISFDDDDAEERERRGETQLEEWSGRYDDPREVSAAASHTRFSPDSAFDPAPWHHGEAMENGVTAAPRDRKPMADEDEEEEDDDDNADEVYGKSQPARNGDGHAKLDGAYKPLPQSPVGWSALQVFNDNDSGELLFPLQADSPTDAAALPMQLAQMGSLLQHRVEPPPPCQAKSVSPPSASSPLSDSMSIGELRQALVAMMNRKDELEEQCRSLRALLESEMEHAASLRREAEEGQRRSEESEERHSARLQALARENEVLKVQLKKYVGAVQMLRREAGHTGTGAALRLGEADPLPLPEPRPLVDTEELASTYERKLIEVAEMHGELMEFNERLHRSLMGKDALIHQMRQELVELRGPLPGDLSQSSEDPSLSDFDSATNYRALVNVWIPSVFLRKKATDTHHVYQVYVRVRDEEWNVYRRYSAFRSLHHSLRKQHPLVDSFKLPPKKALGNKDSRFVEGRRRQLQDYLRLVVNKVVQANSNFTAEPSKSTLTGLHPFFLDAEPSEKRTGRSRLRGPAQLSRQHNTQRNPEPQSGDL